MSNLGSQKKAAARVHKAVRELIDAISVAKSDGVTISFTSMIVTDKSEEADVTSIISPYLKAHCSISVDPESN